MEFIDKNTFKLIIQIWNVIGFWILQGDDISTWLDTIGLYPVKKKNGEHNRQL